MKNIKREDQSSNCVLIGCNFLSLERLTNQRGAYGCGSCVPQVLLHRLFSSPFLLYALENKNNEMNEFDKWWRNYGETMGSCINMVWTCSKKV